MPLNIDWLQILLHLFNFVILAGGLTLLLYVPVTRFMAGRQGRFEQREQDLARREATLADKERQYAELCRQAEDKQRAQDEAAEAQRRALLEASEAEARQAAEGILAQARADARREREQALSNIREEVTELALLIAQGILEREISAEENAALIDACLSDWSRQT
ncbi:MAG: ATP synthase F0 subunit B [Eubacteriales bacterium]